MMLDAKPLKIDMTAVCKRFLFTYFQSLNQTFTAACINPYLHIAESFFLNLQ